MLAAGIEKLIKNGVLVATEDNAKKDRFEYPLIHRFYAPARIGGEGRLVEFTAKESKNGALYYDHVVLKVTKQNRPLAEPGGRSPGVQESVFAVVDGIKKVGQLAEKVKALRPELNIEYSQVLDENGEPLVEIAQQCGHRQKHIQSAPMRQLSSHARLAPRTAVSPRHEPWPILASFRRLQGRAG